MAGLVVDAVPDVLERRREVAGDARHHGVGIAERDDRRRKMVAILIDQALAVAEQETAPLQSFIEIRGVVGIAVREARIDDLDAVAELDPGAFRGRAHALLAADELCGA